MRRRFSRSSRKKRRRRRSLWRWLGLGALGLAGAILLRRPSKTAASSRRREGRAASGPRPAGPRPAETPSPALDPPADLAISWIPGPAGSLRIGERHAGSSKGRPERSVVFVHGLAGCLEHWSSQLAALGPALHGVAVDLPGHGGSDLAADGDYSVSAQAAAIGAAVDGLGLRRPILVAHSLGALAAIDYAGRHPRRVAGLLLVDPSADQSRLPETERERYLATLKKDPRGETEWNFRQFLTGGRPEIADRVLEPLVSLAEEVILGAAEGSQSYPPLPALERFEGSVRLLVSDLNRLPQSLHRLRPDLPARRLTGASNWLMLDRPEAVWEELVELLEDLRRWVDMT